MDRFKKGDMVKCIDDIGVTMYVYKNRSYEVLSVGKVMGAECIEILDIWRIRHVLQAWRFKKID